MDKLEIKQGSFIQQTQYFIVDSRSVENQCFSGLNWFLPDLSDRQKKLDIFFGLVNRESLPDWMSGKVRQTFVISAHYPDSKQTWVFSNSLILCGCHRNNNLILLGFTRLGIPPTIYRIFKTSMPSIIPPLQRQ
jgi:hypothetical protein